MQQKLTATERLIIGIEVKPPLPKGIDWMIDKAFSLAKMVIELGVRCVKVETLARADRSIIEELQKLGLKVFADFKLSGTKDTLAIDAILLKRYKPDLLSFMLDSLETTATQAFQTELPGTKLLGVTVLTNLKGKEFQERHGCSIGEVAIQRGRVAEKANMHGLISAPGEARALERKFGHKMPIYGPAIRPKWANVRNDDQDPERAMTPTEAVRAGVTHLIVQRPIADAENPREATVKILEEIESAA